MKKKFVFSFFSVFALIALTLISFAKVVEIPEAVAGILIGSGAVGGDVTAPEVSSTTIAADGDTVTIAFSETVSTNNYDTGDFDLDCDGAGGANNQLIYSSGDDSNSVVFTTTTTVESGETCNLDYTGGADEIEDTSGNDLEGFTDAAVTNNSEQEGVPACATGSAHITQSSHSGLDSLVNPNAEGQGFTPTSDIYLHSISAHFAYANNCSATMRVGTSIDLSSYLAEASVTGEGTGSITFDFSSTKPQLSNGVTYYWGIVEDSGDCRLSYQNSNVYGGGELTRENSGWLMTGDDGEDRRFVVYSCD